MAQTEANVPQIDRAVMRQSDDSLLEFCANQLTHCSSQRLYRAGRAGI
jgi:hypothetical protein